MSQVEIKNLTNLAQPRVRFDAIKEAILGPDYELSLVFKKNNEAHTILSFPLDKNNGEIFIDLALCKKECASFEKTYTNFIGFLFIHGLLHLKGYDHGSTMEHEEERYCSLFSH